MNNSQQRIASVLESIGLSDDTDLIEYLDGVLCDELLALEEQQESMTLLIAGASSIHEDDTVKALVESLIEQHRNDRRQDRGQQHRDQALVVDSITHLDVTLARTNSTVSDDAVKTLKELREEQVLEELEKKFLLGHDREASELQKVKRRIVEEYGMQFDDTVIFTEDGKMGSGLKEARISQKLASSLSTVSNVDINQPRENDNREQVARAAQQERQKAKETYQKEQAKIRLQKQKVKEKEQKEKKRVAKQERKTGR